MDVYLDGPEGTLLGTFEVEQGLTDFGVVEADVSFAPVDGMHDLVFVYRNEDGGGTVCIGIHYDVKHKNQPAS